MRILIFLTDLFILAAIVVALKASYLAGKEDRKEEVKKKEK